MYQFILNCYTVSYSFSFLFDIFSINIIFPGLILMHNLNYRLLCRTNKHNFTVTVCISVHVTGYRAMVIECVVFVQWLLG